MGQVFTTNPIVTQQISKTPEKITQQMIDESLIIFKNSVENLEQTKLKQLQNLIDTDIKNDLDKQFYKFLQNKPVITSFMYIIPREIQIIIDEIYKTLPKTGSVGKYVINYFEEKGFIAVRQAIFAHQLDTYSVKLKI